jgi:hypothetical protein
MCGHTDPDEHVGVEGLALLASEAATESHERVRCDLMMSRWSAGHGIDDPAHILVLLLRSRFTGEIFLRREKGGAEFGMTHTRSLTAAVMICNQSAFVRAS